MKKLLSFSIIVLTSFTGLSQVYNKMLTDSVRWNYSVYTFFTASIQQTKIETLNDTMLNSNIYKKIAFNNTTTSYFIREDTLQKTVWLRTDTSEFIIYNFSLNLGDSIFLRRINYNPVTNNYTCSGYAIVDSIYSTNTLEGARRTLRLKGGRAYATYTYWIEGNGSINDYIIYYEDDCYLFFDFGYVASNTCTFHDGIQTYQDSFFPQCNNSTDLSTVLLSENLKIYPNPFSNSTTFSFEEDGCYKLKIYDLMGKLIEARKFSGKQLIYENYSLQAGIYFYEMSNEKNHFTRGKLIKE
jgi:hypothetical protein